MRSLLSPGRPALVAASMAAGGLLAACSGGGDTTGPTPPPVVTQRLDIIPAGGAGAVPGLSGKSLAMAPGDTARLSAVVNASNGTSSTASGLTWTVANTAIADVDATGLVKGKAIGVTTMVARTAQYADTLTVTVSTCGSAQTVTLAVGQVQQYAAGQGASLCITAGSASEDYALIAFNADMDSSRATNDVRSSVRVAATGLGASAAAMSELLAAGNPSLSRAGASFAALTPRRDEGFDFALRRTATRVLAPRMSAARTSQSRPAGLRLSVAAAVPTVGQLLTLNAGLEPCDTTVRGADGLNRRVGRVVAITDKAIVVADTGNPAGGFTDTEYRNFGLAFDTLAYPVDVANFGGESDLDKNGRSIIFFTRAVNAMTPATAGYYVGGFFYERDLFQNSNAKADDYCGASNAAEMFYMLVPDPNASVNGNRFFTKNFVSGVTVGTLAHEFQHLINASRRLYVNNADEWEDTWLNEGLSHVAEELVFFKAGGVSPRAPRLDATAIQGSTAVRTSFNTYMNGGNISRLTTYFESGESSSPYAENDDLETRGATWQFLRYVADRVNGTDATLWQKLVSSTKLRGMANLQAALGVNASGLAGWFRDWSIANYVDGLAGGTIDSRFAYKSWNFRSVIGNLKNPNGSFAYPSYPLTARTLADSTPSETTIRPGATAYYRFSVAPGKQSRVATTGTTGPLASNVVVSVVRIK